MRIFFLIYFLLFYCTTSSGQNSATAFLKGFQKEETVLLHREKIVDFSSFKYDLPIIEKLEFRTETNEFNLLKQEYLIRVTPNSLRTIKTQRQFQETVKYMSEMELEVAKQDALRKRYDLLLDYVYLKKIIAAQLKQKVLLEDKVTLLQRSINLPGFEVIDLINAEQELEKNYREILDLNNAFRTTEGIMKRMDSAFTTIQIKDEKLITVADIKRRLMQMVTPDTNYHPMREVQSAKIYNQMLEYEWEAAKSKFSLGYVQAQYAYDSEDSFRKSFSIGVGFEIPFKRKGQLDLNKLQVDILESKSALRTLQSQLVEEQFISEQNLVNLIVKYELIVKQLEKGGAEYALQEYQKIADTPPMAMLKLRENTLKLELLLQQLEYKIFQGYMDNLHHSGLLTQAPLRNYLQNDLETF